MADNRTLTGADLRPSTSAPPQTVEPQPPTHTTPPKTGTDTVTIALKHPHGIILQAYEMVDSGEVTPHGYRSMKIAQQVGAPFTLNGNAVSIEALKSGRMPEHQIVGGFALTPGVPRDLWENWFSANKNGDLVKNGLIRALGTENDARDYARQNAAIESGLEGIDPADPGKRTGIRRIERGTGGANIAA